MSRRFLICPVLICLWTIPVCPSVFAGVGDVTLRTDHPQYPGEGAFQTVPQCVEFATASATGTQEKAIAMYLWFLTHQWHLMSPMEWCVPGRNPDSSDPGDYETVVFDANRGRFSYGYGLCGTVHAWNEPYWKALGMPARRREFPNHVNSEVFYDNAWHAFDTDMAGLLFRRDGVVAGYADLQRDPTLAESVQPPLPHYPFAWPSDFRTMQTGWQQVAAREAWYALYNGGYAAHPGIVHLRSGEVFTRWYDRDHYGGPSRRRFWQHQAGGPFRTWTFFDNGGPVHDADKSNARSQASYCNGEFHYQPSLSKNACREGMTHVSSNVGHRRKSPAMFSTDGKACEVTFRHFSPYVICGDPDDDANPMSGRATDGFVISGRCVGTVVCEVSADEGQTWSDVNLNLAAESNQNSVAFRVDLTQSVKGRYGWQVRFSWQDTSGLDSLVFVTTTQVNQAMYPRLTPDGCDVTFRTQPRGVVAVLPNLGVAESQVHLFEETELRSKNLMYTPRSPTSRYAWQATNDQPAAVVFRIQAPETLQEVRAAVRYQVPVPKTDGCDYRLQVSTDEGQSWNTFAVADVPDDNEFSSGWLSGSADVSKAACRTALVRFQMHSPGRRAAVIDAQLYGIHQLPPSGPLALEFGWLEGGTLQTHVTQVEAGVSEQAVHVPTSGNIADAFIRISSVTQD
ncbi:MAG: hypothetical protein R3C59_30375 [Planctomycetaceae bacterium]